MLHNTEIQRVCLSYWFHSPSRRSKYQEKEAMAARAPHAASGHYNISVKASCFSTVFQDSNPTRGDPLVGQ